MKRATLAVFILAVSAVLMGACEAPASQYEPEDIATPGSPPAIRTEPYARPTMAAPKRTTETDWREGWRFIQRGVCVELRGPNVQTNVGVDWVDVVNAFRAAGLMYYLRTDDGCDAVPWDQKVLVKAYYATALPADDHRRDYYAYVLPWTYQNDACDGVSRSLVCRRLAKAEMWLNLSAMAGLNDTKINAIASHELAHLAGLHHQPLSNNTVMGYVDHRVLTSTDRVRVQYIYQEVPK